MKKLIIIILFLVINMFPQEWGDQIELTYLYEPNLVQMDMFTNNEAVFLVVVDDSNDVRVYKVDTQGNVYSGFPKTITTDGEFPSIAGDNSNLYVTYLSDDSIKTKHSTDSGENWSSLISRVTSGNQCNGIDTDFQSDVGLHMTWATADNGQWYETYYISYGDDNVLNNDFKQVTNYALHIGGFSSIAYSDNRVHVGYTVTNLGIPGNNGIGSTYSRTRYNGTWENPNLSSDSLGTHKVIVREEKLYCFNFEYQPPPGGHYDLKLRYRTFTGSYTSTSLNVDNVDIHSFMGAAVTSNNNLNFAYDDNDLNGHGTSCTQIILHLAPDSIIYPIKIFGRKLESSPDILIKGIEWAIERKLNIINFSLGTQTIDALQPLYRVCEIARRKGIILIAAKSNSSEWSFPAIFENVIGVELSSVSDAFQFEYRESEGIECKAKGIYRNVYASYSNEKDIAGNSFACSTISGITSLFLEYMHDAGIEELRGFLEKYSKT